MTSKEELMCQHVRRGVRFNSDVRLVNVSTKACVTVRKLDKITLSGVLAKAEIEEV